MKKNLNLLVCIFNILFILGRAADTCTNTQVNNNLTDGNGACIDKSLCKGYVTGTSCEEECADSEYASSVTVSGNTYF